MSRERVEGTPRLDGREADAFESGHEHAPTSVVLRDHALHVGFCLGSVATSAASWAAVGADMMMYWCTLTMPSMRSAGAQA